MTSGSAFSPARQFANLTTGCAGGLLFTSTFYLAGIEPVGLAMMAAFIGAVLGYLFFRPPHPQWRPFVLAFLLCAIGYLHAWVSGYLPPSLEWGKKGVLYLSAIAGLVLFALYAPRHFLVKKTSFGLRNTIFKNVVIAFAWTVFTLLPWMLSSPEQDQGLLFLMASRFLLVLGLALLSDLADSSPGQYDRHSLAGRLGFRKTQVLSLGLITCAEVVGWSIMPIPGTMLIPITAGVLLLKPTSKWRNEWVIDSAVAAHAVALIAFS